MAMNARVVLHILFWLVYLFEDTLLEYFWIQSSFPELSPLERFLKGLHANIALLPAKLLLVYFIIFRSIEQGIQKNRKLVPIIAELFAVLLLSLVIHRLTIIFYVGPQVYHESGGSEVVFDARRLLSALLDIGFVAGGAVAMKLARLYFTSREREKTLLAEKLEAELKFLKTQTNPHFLFNTLNNIYALARKKSDHTADVVVKLSKLLRFMLYEARKNRIPLVDEIHMIESYLELERIRYNERLKITFKKQVDNSSQEIAPMILLPFIENAFKHGASEARFESFISINLSLHDGMLDFSIENSKDDHEEKHLHENIGLSNVRRQLELMYKDYELKVRNMAGIFNVSLRLNLHKNATI